MTTTTTTLPPAFGIIKKMRIHKAVWYSVIEYDINGAPVFSDPYQIDCRWQDSVELMEDVDGEEFTSTSKVFPDRPIPVGDYLWEGLLADAPANVRADKFASEVKVADEIPNIKQTQSLYIAIL